MKIQKNNIQNGYAYNIRYSLEQSANSPIQSIYNPPILGDNTAYYKNRKNPLISGTDNTQRWNSKPEAQITKAIFNKSSKIITETRRIVSEAWQEEWTRVRPGSIRVDNMCTPIQDIDQE